MSTKKQHLVAFIALLFPAILFANSINVTFDAALTNETGWVYIGNIKPNKEGDYYINGQGATIISPCYNFAITSIVLHISTSPSCNRNLIISSYDNVTSSLSHEFTDIPKGTTSDVTATWNISDHVRSLAITSTSGSQSLYFLSAIISGVPIVEVPTNLQTNDIKGTRCRLSWENPDENAVSNKIEVSRVVRKEEYSTMLDEYDFVAFTNTSPQGTACYNKNTLQMNVYSSFSGTNIYKAANSTGVVQISSTDYKGYLQYDFSTIREALNETANVSMLVSAKKHHTDTVGTWGLLITVSNITNTASSSITNELTHEFPTSPYLIPLGNITTNSMLILKPSDTTSQSNRRILIDYLAFVRDYSPASVSTNYVKAVFASGTTATIRGLSPYSSYIASITAFDADGNESEPSEPISFMTNGAELPLVIRLQ